MEMALNMGAFEALDQQEMMEIDGGGPVENFALTIVTWLVDGISKFATGKSVADHIADGIQYFAENRGTVREAKCPMW